MHSVSFALFLALWNRVQGQSTPEVHFRIADWLEARWCGGDRSLLLMAFRSCGKSTLVGLFAAWLFARDPDLRILVLAADLALARKMVRNVKRIIERHPVTTGLKPDRADQWASERFTLNRTRELRDPSMLARGISSNLTGSRADVIVCDDVEVPNTCDTADKRADLRERLGELDFILTPGGTRLYVGTPHSWHSIYAAVPCVDAGEDRAFLDGYARLEVPVMTAAGESAWPERFPLAEIGAMRRRAGPAKFDSQMMLRPVNIAQGRLDPGGIRFYIGAHALDPVTGGAVIGDCAMRRGIAWWDPAFGKQGGDRSVLAIVFTDESGAYWLHRLVILNRKGDDAEAGETDEASRQCAEVAAHLGALQIRRICIEINGLGRFLPGILRKTLAKTHPGCAVAEISSRRPKALRIMEAFDAVLASDMLYAHESIKKTPFMRDLREWRPDLPGVQNGGGGVKHDDCLDAVAGAISELPLKGRFESRDPFRAKTGFRV